MGLETLKKASQNQNMSTTADRLGIRGFEGWKISRQKDHIYESSEVLQEQKVVTLVRVAELWLIYAAGIRAGLWRSPKSH